jgi:apolipoprotein N-acyltransferase
MTSRFFGWCDEHPRKAAALSGLILAFCHPFVLPGSAGPPVMPWLGAIVAWVALVPLLRAIGSARSKRDLLVMAYLSFGLQLGLSVYWLDVPINRFGGLPHIVSVLAIIAIALITGAYFVIGFIAARFTADALGWRLRYVLPWFWLSADYVRGAWIYGYPLSGFPWAHLSATQVEHPLIRQLAAIGGIDFIGLWLFGINLTILAILEAPRTRRPLLGLAALLLPALIWGAVWRQVVHTKTAAARTIRLGIIQGNLSQDIKNQLNNRNHYMLDIQRRLSAKLAAEKPDLILWSEVTYPVALARDNPRLRAADLGYTEEAPAPAVSLVGATVFWQEVQGVCTQSSDCARGSSCRDGRCQGYAIHNSMLAFDAQMGLLGRTDKHHLVPFGEYVPGLVVMDALGIRQLVPVAGRMRPAATIAPVRTPVAVIGGLICYEGVFPGIPLRLRRAGAELLVNPTNDTWYGRTSGPWQHLAFYRFRAVEAGLSVARAANSGISGWFDPRGDSHDLTDLDVEAAFVSTVPLPVIDTPWVLSAGALRPLILLTAPALFIFAGLRRRRGVSGPCEEAA